MLLPVLECSAYLDAEVDIDDPDRPVYLLGESFGAVLALAVAAAKTDLVDRLVLVNPATSYENSIWPRLGPALAKLPDVCPLLHSQDTHAQQHSCSAQGSTGLMQCCLGKLCYLIENVFHQMLECFGFALESSSRLVLIRQGEECISSWSSALLHSASS